MTEIDYTFKDSDHRILHDDGKQKSHGKKTENTSLSNSSRSAAAPKEEGSFIKKGTKTISYFAQKTADGLKTFVPSLLPGVGISTEMITNKLIDDSIDNDNDQVAQAQKVSDKPDFTIKFNCD